MIAITRVDLFTPRLEIRDATILIDGKTIAAIGPRNEVAVPAGATVYQLDGKLVFPGFIDVHTHGLLGLDAMSEDLYRVIREFPRFGVTSFLATTVTLPYAEIEERLRVMSKVIAAAQTGASCLGIHLEGPHLSPRRPGMANPAWFHPLERAEFEALQAAADGWIRMLTFAPEEGDALELIPHLIAGNVVPVIGHSDASFEHVERAVSLGLAHATHTFNAMNAFHHRSPGVIGAVLAFEQIVAQLIADGHHVHRGAMKALLNAKGVDGVCLISDSAPFAGLPEGEYGWMDYSVVVREGMCRLRDGTLAGAHALMDTGFRNLIDLAGLSPSEASICASEVPARVLGLEKKGQILPGFDADLAVLDRAYLPYMTIVGGAVSWSQAQLTG